MGKKQLFLLLVQTWVSFGSHLGGVRQSQRFAISTLYDASKIEESKIPEDVGKACEEYCMWQDSLGGKRPAWLAD